MQSTHRNNGSPEAATSNEPIRESSSMAVDHSNGGAVNDDPFPAFPAEYKKQQRWCLWKYELKEGKLTKVPYRNLAQRSSHSDPARWISYDIAVSNYRCYASGEQPTPEGRVAGIGIFNNSDFTSIDLDKCRDQNTGELEPWAEKLVQEIGSYAEYSPSGSGVHIFTRGTVKKSAKMNGCEIYSQQRFFTVTGKPLPKAPAQVSEYPKLAELRENIAGNRLRPYQLENASDGQTVPAPSSGGLVLVAKAPADFDRLWAGDPVYISERYNGDERAADQGLANLLASRLNGNFAAVEAAFTESALGQREKWRGREDYRERTINKAIADWQKYQPSRPEVDPDNWRGLFHSYDQIMNAPPITFAVDGFLQEDSITMLGGLSGHGKTLVALATVRALVEGKPLFDYFKVPRTSQRVIYLVPECSLTQFAYRLRLFHLMDCVKDGRLLVRTLSAAEDVSITDPRILRAAEGADVYLDTAVRFMEGNENDASEQRVFARNLFALLKAGARTVTGLHHSAKNQGQNDYLTLEGALRGSGDIGAMLSTCWAVRQTDPTTNQLYIQNVKPRDFEPCAPFVLEGRPWLNQTGYFKMLKAPGLAGELKAYKKRPGPPERAGKADKLARAVQMREQGTSQRQIAAELKVSQGTVAKWLSEYDEGQALETAYAS